MPEINDLKTPVIKKFWQHMIRRHRDEAFHGLAKPEGVRWHELEQVGLVVSLTVGLDFARVFIRGPENQKASQVRERLERWDAELGPLLKAPLRTPGESNRFYSLRYGADMNDEEKWNEVSDFLFETAERYETSLLNVLGGQK